MVSRKATGLHSSDVFGLLCGYGTMLLMAMLLKWHKCHITMLSIILEPGLIHSDNIESRTISRMGFQAQGASFVGFVRVGCVDWQWGRKPFFSLVQFHLGIIKSHFGSGGFCWPQAN